MAYNRKYLLTRIKEVNEIYLHQSRQGLSNEYIYIHFIRDQFHLSRSTFYEYLTVPYNKELSEIRAREEEAKRMSPTLFDNNENLPTV